MDREALLAEYRALGVDALKAFWSKALVPYYLAKLEKYTGYTGGWVRGTYTYATIPHNQAARATDEELASRTDGPAVFEVNYRAVQRCCTHNPIMIVPNVIACNLCGAKYEQT